MLKRWCGVGVALLVGIAAGHGQTASQKWVGTWATSAMGAEGGFAVKVFADSTLREVVHISAGGPSVRVRFTNEFGKDPLTINDAHVAVSTGAGGIKDGTDHAVTFGSAASVRIAPGATIYSDAVNLATAPLSDLAISFHVPAQVMRAETFHGFADQENWMAHGDVADAPTLPSPVTLTAWYFISGVDVAAEEGSRAVVTLGDSITDGALSTVNANRRWPDVLASRLSQEHGTQHVSVLNEGIGGNRVLNEGYGPSAVTRLDRDVLAQNGAKYLVILEGINDIGRLQRLQGPEDEITTQEMELGLKQIADRGHLHGLKVYGATLTPYGGAGYFSDKGEQIREEVNQWIRTSGTFDGVIDFDQITRDPQNPNRFNPLYDSGDHLHPNDAGYKAMGEGVDLKLFR
ncbi:MAG TPA: SGNH/GDSL hydrolase family protein [Terracidiphilus sp.]